MVWFGNHPRAVRRCVVLASCLFSHGVRAESSFAPSALAEQREQCLKAHESGQLLRLDAKLVEAKRSLTLCAAEACPNAVRADCTAWLSQLAETTPSIVLAATSERGDETHVRVLLDGAELTSNLDGKAIELDPGPHSFLFELPPYLPLEREIVLREGERERMLAIRFEREPAKPLIPGSPAPVAVAPVAQAVVPGPRPVPWISYALGGLSLAAIGSATTFGLIALHERREKLDGCAPLCSGHDKSDVELPAQAADISVAVALIAGGAAVYTYWTRPEVAQRPRISISSGTRFALLRYRGEF